MDWCRAWLTLEDDRPVVVPAYAERSSIKLDRERSLLSLKFRRNRPEIDAVLHGFRYCAGAEFIGNFECKLNGQNGTLKPIGRGFSMDANDLETCDISAYFTVSDGKEAVTIAIVPELSGSRQIILEPGGTILASADLVGKTIKVRCVYPDAVQMTTEKIESVTAHLIGVEDNKIFWVWLPGCQMQVGNPLKLQVDWHQAKSECIFDPLST